MYQYPEDCYKCTTAEIRNFIANDNPLADIRVMVAEVDDESAGKVVIAHTVWDMMAVGLKEKEDAASTSSEEVGDGKSFSTPMV